MQKEVNLVDIADDLLIVNRITIEKLFKLDNCVDCVALYMFYYKTAKWQKTNVVKVNDNYLKSSLKWGTDRIRKTKQILKENGLIDIIQRRKNGKICGWYVQVNYLMQAKNIEDIKIVVEDNSNNTQEQQLLEPTTGSQDTNALKEYIICLENKINMLKKEEINKESNNNEIVEQVIDHLNMKTNSNYKATNKKTITLINARLKEGYTEKDFLKVIDKKCLDWLRNDYQKYLRPETLFGTKFESYLNQKTKEERRMERQREMDSW